MLDNGCDTSHFGFVHAGTFGGDAAAVTRAKSVERDGWLLHASYETTYEVLDDPTLEAGGVAQQSSQTKTFIPGGSILLRMMFPRDGSVFTILTSLQPERDGSTRMYRWWARNDIVGDEARWAACIAVEEEVQQEDVRMLNAYRDHRLPLDLRREVHVGDDRMSVAYRRLLAELVDAPIVQEGEVADVFRRAERDRRAGMDLVVERVAQRVLCEQGHGGRRAARQRRESGNEVSMSDQRTIWVSSPAL